MRTAENTVEQEPVVEVEVGMLSTAGSPRTDGPDPEHVAQLAAVQTDLPPIIVHRATMRVVDGAHRLEAAMLQGRSTIAVRFFEGDDADAFVLAVASNTTHGLPLSPADRKAAAGRIITSHPHWSDRMIASIAGIAPGTVAGVRRSLVGPGVGLHRVGQDGRVRPIDGSAGRRRAGELLLAHPDRSLREIAAEAGVSPETVRDVRNRLRRGEAPPPPRRSRPRVRGQVSTTAAVQRLRQDPSLRFSETGRNLLRMLEIHFMQPNDWAAIIDNVPPHCGPMLADLGRRCAQAWAEFAVQMERDEISGPATEARASR